MNSFTIGYDASSTVGPRTGIGIAAARMLDAITAELPDGWRINALVNSAKLPLPDDPWTRAANVKIIRRRIPGRLLLRSWQYLRAPAIERLAGDVTLFHSPASYIFPARAAKRIITVHDLYFLEAARTVTHDEPEEKFGGGYFKATFPRGLHEADRIIAVSEYTRQDVIKTYGIPPEKVVTIPNGVDLEAFSERPSKSDRETALTLGDTPRFILCVASSGPTRRKNILGLLDAYARACALQNNLPPLVIVGHTGAPELAAAYERKLDELNLRARVRHMGYMKSENLAAYYRAALFNVIPSLSEGFGIPALEAMACGCPVLAASTGALPEVIGDAGLLMDIASVDAMANQIIRMSNDESLRMGYKDSGLHRAREFTWQNAAKKTIEIYRETLS